MALKLFDFDATIRCYNKDEYLLPGPTLYAYHKVSNASKFLHVRLKFDMHRRGISF